MVPLVRQRNRTHVPGAHRSERFEDSATNMVVDLPGVERGTEPIRSGTVRRLALRLDHQAPAIAIGQDVRAALHRRGARHNRPPGRRERPADGLHDVILGQHAGLALTTRPVGSSRVA